MLPNTHPGHVFTKWNRFSPSFSYNFKYVAVYFNMCATETPGSNASLSTFLVKRSFLNFQKFLAGFLFILFYYFNYAHCTFSTTNETPTKKKRLGNAAQCLEWLLRIQPFSLPSQVPHLAGTASAPCQTSDGNQGCGVTEARSQNSPTFISTATGLRTKCHFTLVQPLCFPRCLIGETKAGFLFMLFPPNAGSQGESSPPEHLPPSAVASRKGRHSTWFGGERENNAGKGTGAYLPSAGDLLLKFLDVERKQQRSGSCSLQ